MSSSKISGLSHPVRSQLGSFTISLACCEVKVVGIAVSNLMSRVTGVTVSVGVFGSISMGTGMGLESFRGEIDGECSACLLLVFLTGVREVS